MTVARLVRLLVDTEDDGKIQFPALKAVANMLTTDTALIVDKALEQKVLENLLKLAYSKPWCTTSQSLEEICYCFSSIACGEERQI